MIRLKDEHIRPLHRSLHGLGNNAEIRRQRAAMRALEAKTARLRCIVRDRKGTHGHSTNGKVVRNGVHILRKCRAAVDARERSARCKDRHMILLGERFQPAHMVDMLMCHEHGVQRLRLDTARAQPLRDPRRTDARIDQNTHTVQLHID